ncbi:glycoside hydrolase family 13 protein [Limosilactobacillus mucosae]|uniref:glycoside hydrolase family 13 protein n=1 Tax=Limosilactobacillus mucosae TaxID=97478 RepID=UPI0025A42BAB|nr:glycoside hydrolase family 13 protein [Limosilactobacillus mucosae]MDM8220548.1 glycoside hydrolase family 13 protein [Limosilactobacillus mucosae]MDM8315124.1 glycoside hydrolase family 13 protein [Limosilactobacillus mucosae]
MNFAGVYHRPESEMAYLYTKDIMHIRLKTAKDDIAGVSLLHGDPYSLCSRPDLPKFYTQPTPMKKIHTDELFDYWQLAVTEPKKRLAYAFELIDQSNNCFIYTDQGFIKSDDLKMLEDANTYFRMPYFQDIDAFHAPKWVEQTVWYQIFPERFANGDAANDPVGTKPWDPQTHPGRQDFYGGDLQGVINHLDYLKQLGVNGLYFNPIFKAPSNHKYDTQDYYQIDPHFGDAKLFKKLVEQAHQRGMRVMLDAVFNHIGDQSPMWQDVLKNGQDSKYADWFHINRFPVTYTPTDNFEFAKDATYDTFDYTPHMPKLNTANPKVQDWLLDIAGYWVREFDIDAWRLDVANEIDHHFWRRFHNEMLTLKDDFYILGEIWHSAQPWLNGDEFTGVMNYDYTGAIINHFIKHELSSQGLVERLSHQLMLYRDQTNAMMFNVLNSHDTARIMTLANEDDQLVRQTLAFTFLQPGSPSIYYGTEYGMTGGNDPDCRKPMNWYPDAKAIAMHDFVRDLIKWRKEHWQLIAQGTIELTALPNDQGIVIKRQLQHKQLTAVFNTGRESLDCQLVPLISQGLQKRRLRSKGFVIAMQN